MSAQDYCTEKAAPAGSSLYYAVRRAPALRRRLLTAVYAFAREVEDVERECADFGVARLKLDWWREQSERLFEGQARHPVMQALLPHLAESQIEIESLLRVIDGAEEVLDRTEFDDFPALEQHCGRCAGTREQLAARALGFTHPATLDFALELGVALRLTEILRDLKPRWRRGCVDLPRSDRERLGLSDDALSGRETTPALRVLFEELTRRARSRYATALRTLPPVDGLAQRSGVIQAALQQATLAEIERDGFQVLKHRVSLTPLRKTWIAWRHGGA